jgi:hypothetical protein
MYLSIVIIYHNIIGNTLQALQSGTDAAYFIAANDDDG